MARRPTPEHRTISTQIGGEQRTGWFYVERGGNHCRESLRPEKHSGRRLSPGKPSADDVA